MTGRVAKVLGPPVKLAPLALSERSIHERSLLVTERCVPPSP